MANSPNVPPTETLAPNRENSESISTVGIEFRGSAREYFRIWIVNLCLSLVTLGVFSAWAKVRKKRYFYSSTSLDGTPFQYLARPIPILKGRLIAAALFAVYYMSIHVVTRLLPYVLIIVAVLAPWVIVRSAAFNARYSAYRNMTFTFSGTYWDALKTIYWLGLMPLIFVGTRFNWWGDYKAAGAAFVVFGISFPWWMSRFKKFLVNNTSYGGEPGELSVSGGQFFKIYLAGGVVVLAGGLVGTGMAISTFSVLKKPVLWSVIFGLPFYAAYVLAFAYVQARSTNLVWNQAQLGPLRFESTLRGRGLARLYVTNALGIIGSVGLLIPWAVIRTMKYRLDNLRVLVVGDLTELRGSKSAAVQAVGAELGAFFDVDLSL